MNKTLIVLVIITIIAFTYYVTKTRHYIDTVNTIFKKFCHDPAIFNTHQFPWTINFRNNWIDIRDEYINYSNHNIIPIHRDLNSEVSSCDVNHKWRTLYLRAYGIDTNVSTYFPTTMNLLNQCPCTLAFFSVLEPGAKLTPHVGIYKGVLRYHLGLIIPQDVNKCFINVDGTKLHWREGNDIMFDDIFMHHVENNTNEPRVILFLDIKRDFHNILLNALNTLSLKFIKSNDILLDTIANVNMYAS